MENDGKTVELVNEANEKLKEIFPIDPIEQTEKERDERDERLKRAAVDREKEAKVELSATEKVIEELNQKIEQAEEAGSYFVTITRKEGEKLKHWMGGIRFPKDDRAHSLRELLKKVPSAYNGKEGNIRKFGPRKHGG